MVVYLTTPSYVEFQDYFHVQICYHTLGDQLCYQSKLCLLCGDDATCMGYWYCFPLERRYVCNGINMIIGFAGEQIQFANIKSLCASLFLIKFKNFLLQLLIQDPSRV